MPTPVAHSPVAQASSPVGTVGVPPAEKPRYPRAQAIEVARQLCTALAPVTERLIVAGSLRRRKPDVGDIELLYIPKVTTRQIDMFASAEFNLADEAIQRLLLDHILGMRANSKGSFAWGEKNKLAVHIATGIPVDLFAATPENWYNYLVCRTGPAALNTRIASEAQRRGWQWNPYGTGFSRGGPLSGPREIHPVHSEEEVFQFVGLAYLEPQARQ